MENQIVSHPDSPHIDASPIIAGPWLTLARGAWLLITGVGVGLYIVGVRLLFQRLATVCTGADCLREQLPPEALPTLQEIGLTLPGYAFLHILPTVIFAVVCLVVGMLMFWQRSNEFVAFIISLWLVTFGLTLFEQEVRAAGAAYPWLQPAALLVIWLGGVILLPLFFCIFPNGRFVPGWTKWAWLGTSVTFVALATGTEASPAFNAAMAPIVGYLWFSMVLGGIAVQFYRFRKLSTIQERQQTKWVVFAFLVTVVVLVSILLVTPNFLDFSATQSENVVQNIISMYGAVFAFLAIPIGIGIAILRHRLFDIDLVIRRTLQYTLVTGILALTYLGGVVILQGILGLLTGSENSPVVTVMTTLGMAALFNPLRSRVQDFIDRRFYRKKFDAARTLARFAETARDEVDMEKLTSAMLGVVDETMQSEPASLWLKKNIRVRGNE